MPARAQQQQTDIGERVAALHVLDVIVRDMNLGKVAPRKARAVILKVLEDASTLVDRVLGAEQ